MSFYYVLLHGDGVSIPATPEALAAAKLGATGAENRNAITGFWTTRWVRAQNEAAAARSAKSSVMHELSELGLTTFGSDPVLLVEEMRRIGWLTYLTGKPRRGFTFYSEQEPEAAASSPSP